MTTPVKHNTATYSLTSDEFNTLKEVLFEASTDIWQTLRVSERRRAGVDPASKGDTPPITPRQGLDESYRVHSNVCDAQKMLSSVEGKNVPASEPSTTVKHAYRTIVCCFCNKGWNYTGEQSPESLMSTVLDHEKVCPRNPYRNKISKYETALRAILAQESDTSYVCRKIARQALDARAKNPKK